MACLYKGGSYIGIFLLNKVNKYEKISSMLTVIYLLLSKKLSDDYLGRMEVAC